MTAAVVLFPFVPVMASTGAGWKSSNHTAVAVVTVTPTDSAAISSSRYRLTPGDRTTTSKPPHSTWSGDSLCLPPLIPIHATKGMSIEERMSLFI